MIQTKSLHVPIDITTIQSAPLIFAPIFVIFFVTVNVIVFDSLGDYDRVAGTFYIVQFIIGISCLVLFIGAFLGSILRIRKRYFPHTDRNIASIRPLTPGCRFLKGFAHVRLSDFDRIARTANIALEASVATVIRSLARVCAP